MKHPRKDKQAILRDIAAGILSPQQIALKYSIAVDIVYTMKSVANRHLRKDSLESRIKEESRVLDTGLRERIKDMREMDLTSTEIADLLNKEGANVTLEDVMKVMARGSTTFYRQD